MQIEPHARHREIPLRSAISLNLMNMIGVGPFITLPLVAAALGPGAWLGWVAGALLAVCDGLVWAELGAALPRAGGSYAFLREIYKPSALAGAPGAAHASFKDGPLDQAGLTHKVHPARETADPVDTGTLRGHEGAMTPANPGRARASFDAGRFISFLYVWQLTFTAPLSVASGALGLAQYAAYLLPQLGRGFAAGPLQLRGTSVLAAGVCLLVLLLLSRGLAAILQTAALLTTGVLLTLATVIAAGFAHLRAPLVDAQLHWPHGPGLAPALGAAALITTYDYWGYYNVCFLGDEVRDPGRTIPRAVIGSIVLVAALYLLMNFAVLGALPVPALLTAHGTARPMAAVLFRSVIGGRAGRFAAAAVSLLIIWTAFSSIVSLLLSYSRAPWAAAREGNFFAPFARTHPRHGHPQMALLTLGLIALVFCFFDLRSVIAALVAVRIVLQYGLQQIGVIVLRFRQPALPRPFRLWFYPLPPLLALAAFLFLLFARQGAARELAFAVALGVSGALLFVWRERWGAASLSDGNSQS